MKIWILNHYATNMYMDQAGRHHGMAKYLILRGHDVKIFCANTVHNSDEIIDLHKNLYVEKIGADNVPYVFVRTAPYSGNGISRIRNMMGYARNVVKVIKQFVNSVGKPDIIVASSVHPLTLVAGIRLGKKLHIPCICEIRDPWPVSIVEYGNYSEKNIIIKLLYKMEKWIYKKADSLIFTMAGCKEYIIDKGWQNEVDLGKIYYINNGVDLELFDRNRKDNIMDEETVDLSIKHHIVYAGSIRPANNIRKLVDLAEALNREKIDNIDIMIYGDGPDLINLRNRVEALGLGNIKFKGRVDKKFIPYIISKSGVLNFHVLKKVEIQKYGISPNKLFEYFASGNPVISNIKAGYDLIEKNGVGRIIDLDDPTKAAIEISGYINLLEVKESEINQNIQLLSKEYSHENLSEEFQYVIEETIARYKYDREKVNETRNFEKN